MRYKVVDYYSKMNKHETGTCDLCFGTAEVDDGIITLEDEMLLSMRFLLLCGIGEIMKLSILIM
jgi:hypothetical protein